MIDILLQLLKGVPTTIGITLGSFSIGAIGAIPLVLMRRSKLTTPRLLARMYIDVARGIPPLVWLFVIFFGVGTGFVTLNSLEASLIGLGMVSAAYLAEIYRGGFLALPRGQLGAGTALGMTQFDILRFVTAPQVLRVSIPPMATFLVGLLKDSAVVSTIGVRDTMMFASQQAQATAGGFAPFIIAAGLYILMSIPVAFVSRKMDAKLRGRISQ
ncbi:amino acid ABC transporter permease [Burkholderia sp. MR1-5-21]